ncbi:MAG: GNAT family protein [Chloroflexota bacterium]
MTLSFQYHVNDHLTLELQSPFHTRDVFDLVLANRDFIGEHLSWARQINTLNDMTRYLRRDLMGMAHERRWAWLIRYDGKIVGRIGLFITVPALQECELYYFLDEHYTGKGIITQVARIVVDFAVNVLHLKHILIGFSPQNPKSGAVAERLGFQYEYTMRDIELHGKEWRSLHFWGILAKDWQPMTKTSFDYTIIPHITLRLYQPFQSSDKYRVLRQNQAEFSQWFWWASDSFTLAKERDIARKMLKRYAKASAMAITIWQDNQLVGHASLSIDSKNNGGSIGYWLDSKARGQGIITQTAHALMDTAFKQFGVERMKILAATHNTGSRAVAERIGMQLELQKQDETLIRGRFVNHIQYRLLRSEWIEKEHA